MWEPFGVADTDASAYWKAGPNGRGTLSILSICILTLLLCAYTSLHMNIPDHGKATWFRLLVLKVLWVIVGLAAPEVVAFIAFRQWLFARNFERQMNDIFRTSKKGASDVEQNTNSGRSIINSRGNDPKEYGRDFAWTRKHSHFALMGGFVFETPGSLPKFLPNDRTRLTLTPYALRKLADYQPDLIPDISVTTIQDKSKANWFAKVLVCIQACWFIAQVVGRLIQAFPISLLEMNVLLHALCCLIIYLAWWDKPLDIDEPELIKANTDLSREVCAWMVMSSKTGYARPVYNADGKAAVPAKGYLVFDSDMNASETDKKDTKWQKYHDQLLSWAKDAPRQGNVCPGPPSSYEQSAFSLHPGQKIYGFRFVYDNAPESMWTDTKIEMRLSQPHLECLRLAHKLRDGSDPDIGWRFNYNAARISQCGHSGMLVTHIPVTSSLEDDTLANFTGSWWLTRWMQDNTEPVFYAGLLLAGSLYGMVHLLAWSGPFPSQTERWMWRISCMIIASPFVLALVGIVVVVVSTIFIEITMDWLIVWLICAPFRLVWRTLDYCLCSHAESIIGVPCFILAGLAVLCIVLAYAGARGYLVVECFINLFHLPSAVYLEPEWTKFIPHVTAG